MMNEEEMQSLHTNQRLLVGEMHTRGIDVRILDRTIELLEATYKGHNEFLLDRDSSVMPYSSSVVCGDKFLAKNLLRRAGLSITEGEAFCKSQIDDALIYAQALGFPLVVKPNFGSHGDHVHMNLENLCEVKEAIDRTTEAIGDKAFIVEEQFDGQEYRVFITKEGKYAVLLRDPAHVIGDGESNIETLARIENERRSKRENCLCPLVVDTTFLSKKGKNLSYTPSKREKVYIRPNSNVATGAICEDFTERVHPSVIDISQRVLEVFHGLPYAGIDFMTSNVENQQTDDSYRIIEVNSVPGIHMHMRPGRGKPINVAGYIVDMIFPETKK
jgi:cyanophycin synthetase